MFDGITCLQHVKSVAKHSNDKPHWWAIAEPYTRVENENILADFVVYGNWFILLNFDVKIFISTVFFLLLLLQTVSYRMKSETIMSNWFTMAIQRVPVMCAISVVKVSIKQAIYKSILKAIIRLIRVNVPKRKKTKVKCVQFVAYGWAADIVWNYIVNAIQWNQIDARNAVWKHPIMMPYSATFVHSMRFDALTNADCAINHSILPMNYAYVFLSHHLSMFNAIHKNWKNHLCFFFFVFIM